MIFGIARLSLCPVAPVVYANRMTRNARSMFRLSCGVLITYGARLLLGHPTRSRRWDFP
jgi:hypothetical protein